jgi:hypothetical protein
MGLAEEVHHIYKPDTDQALGEAPARPADMESLDRQMMAALGRAADSDECMARVSVLELLALRLGMFDPGPAPPHSLNLSPEAEHAFRWAAGRVCIPLVVGSRRWWRWYLRAQAVLAAAADYRGEQEIREHHVTPKRERPTCGAKCRDGHLCQAPAVWDRGRDRPRNGRCRVHGGQSTGARTPEGKARVREVARHGGRAAAEKRRQNASEMQGVR